MYQFLSLLKAVRIEEAIQLCMQQDIQIIFNGVSKSINRENWLRFLKIKFLNKFTKVVQFKVTKVESEEGQLNLLIYMICRRYNGNLFFTEIQVENCWKDELIYQTNYRIINH